MAYKIATWRGADINGKDFILDLYSKTTDNDIVLFDTVNSLVSPLQDNQSDYFDFIIGSTLKVSFNVNDADEEAIINIIASAPENDIYCYYRSLTTGIFKGYLVPELITIQNSPKPYSLNLTFTDSIGKLKEYSTKDIAIPEYWGGDESPLYTTYQLIKKVLILLEIDDLYTDGDKFLEVVPGFVASNSSSVNPIDSAYLFTNGVTDNKSISCYDLINELCRMFHSRFYYENNKYYFVAINKRLNSTFKIYQYGFDDVVSSATISNPAKTIDHSDIIIIDGSTISFLPGVYRTSLKFKTNKDDRASILMNYKWDSQHYTTPQNVGSIFKTDNTKLHLEFEYNFWFKVKYEVGAPYVGAQWKILSNFIFAFYITLGNYSLKRTYTELDESGYPVFDAPVWEAPGYVYMDCARGIHDYGVQDSEGYRYYFLRYTFVIDTPEIEETGDLNILLYYSDKEIRYRLGNNYYEFPDGTIQDPTQVFFKNFSYKNVFNYLRVENEEGQASDIEYVLLNDSKYFKILEFNGIYLDAPVDKSTEFFQINEGGELIPVESWLYEEGSVDDSTIMEHFVNSVAKLRQSIRLSHVLNLYIKNSSKYISLNDIVMYDDIIHLITGIEKDHINCFYTVLCTALQQGTISNNITKVKNDVNIFAGGNNSEINNYNSGNSNDNTGTDQWEKRIETTLPLIPQNDPEIPINGMIGMHFEGDYFRIYNDTWSSRQNRASEILMLTEDIDDGGTEMITKGALTKDYAIYSIIEMFERPRFRSHNSDICTTYMDIPIIKGLLPDPAILSLDALRRKIKVKNQGVEMRLVLVDDLEHYNDFAVNPSDLSQLLFTTDQTGNFIIIDFEPWENILPT